MFLKTFKRQFSMEKCNIFNMTIAGSQPQVAPGVVPNAGAAIASAYNETTLVVSVVLSAVLSVLITVAVLLGVRYVRKRGRAARNRALTQSGDLTAASSIYSGSSAPSNFGSIRSKMYLPESNDQEIDNISSCTPDDSLSDSNSVSGSPEMLY